MTALPFSSYIESISKNPLNPNNISNNNNNNNKHIQRVALKVYSIQNRLNIISRGAENKN